MHQRQIKAKDEICNIKMFVCASIKITVNSYISCNCQKMKLPQHLKCSAEKYTHIHTVKTNLAGYSISCSLSSSDCTSLPTSSSRTADGGSDCPRRCGGRGLGWRGREVDKRGGGGECGRSLANGDSLVLLHLDNNTGDTLAYDETLHSWGQIKPSTPWL